MNEASEPSRSKATKQPILKSSDNARLYLPDPGCPQYCARADAMLGLDGFHVLTVAPTSVGVTYEIETGDDLAGCPSCGVVATLHNRRDHTVHEIPGPLGAVRLVWKKRIWRCWEPACPVATWSEHRAAIPARAKLTARTGPWLVDRMEHHDAHVV